MSQALPPVVKLAERVRAEIECAVKQWARYHRYAHGTALRQRATRVVQVAHQAWREREQRAAHNAALAREADMLKADLRLAQDIKAFCSFGQFAAIMLQAERLGEQIGAIIRSQHSKGQNAAASRAAAARPDTEYPGRLAEAKP